MLIEKSIMPPHPSPPICLRVSIESNRIDPGLPRTLSAAAQDPPSATAAQDSPPAAARHRGFLPPPPPRGARARSAQPRPPCVECAGEPRAQGVARQRAPARPACLDLVRRVPLFDEMDERMLGAICERLRPTLYTRGTRLVRELDPVDSMLFIIRGYLDSYTTQGGRSGFFNSCWIDAGEFCGEELLSWALDPRAAASSLPLSTRTVRAVSEVEAFVLIADDLRFVASQFWRLHSARIRHRFRFYSHQWRTWAACFIRAAWRRHKRRRASVELRVQEGGDVRGGGGSLRTSQRHKHRWQGAHQEAAMVGL